MRKMSIRSLTIFTLILTALPVYAQTGEGDQFLDGIGETALIARYLFNGNTEDGSRNTRNASLAGSQAAFTEDEQFGTVLALPGGADGAYIQIPSTALAGVESFSLTGWVNLDGRTVNQRFFDFGRDAQHYLYCTPTGPDRSDGCRVRITTTGPAGETGPSAFRIRPGRWVHLAAVLDAANKTLNLYIDGKRVGQTPADLTLADIVDPDNPQANRFYIGKSSYGQDARLNGKLYDVRLYSIALTDRQVAVIRHNAISDEDIMAADESTEPQAAETKPESTLLTAAEVVEVPHVKLSTPVGVLPRLPYYIPVRYRDNAAGPMVRVIWPAPTDNKDVAEPGTYTVTGTVPGTAFEVTATVTVKADTPAKARPQQNLEAFGLGQVTLNPYPNGQPTPFIKNRDKFIQGLAKTDPDSFLYNFRDAFGQEQPDGVRPLGGWDSQTTRLRGHASGHYLTAIAQACASTSYDAALHADFEQKMNYMIDVLYKLSQLSGKPAAEGGPFNADPTTVPTGPGKDDYDSDLSKDGIRTDYWNWGEGFISGYPPDQFIMLEHGASYGGRNNQIWAPYYTLHKILAGLMDCYEVGGNPKALEIAKGMGLWVYKRLEEVPTETRIRMWNRYIAGEYGGMNEAMARLYRITGDERFLEGARLFDNIDFFFGNADHDHGLAKNVDTIRGKHANQHIPQITGSLETYKGTHDPAYYKVAEHFWDRCTHSYMYCIGGVAGAQNPNNAECFTAQPDTLFTNGFSRGGQNETCATYNLLKLSRALFMFEQQTEYMDYYEQALYNHILASVDEDNPGNTYHVPLNPGSRKRFGNARMDGFTCCNGTALESSTKLQDSIYFKGTEGDALYVNLYVPSTLSWKQKDVTLTQKTAFPYADTSVITINGSSTFDLHLRVPKWIRQGFSVTVNGQQQTVEANPGTYLTLSRTWKDGDAIAVKMPMDFSLLPVMDQPNIAAIFYGPVLLAAEEPERRSEWRPLTLDAENIGTSFTGDPSTLRFRSNGVNFKPFYETYDRYSVYFDITLE